MSKVVPPSLDDEKEIPLLRADQDMINEFARLNSRKQRATEALNALQTEYDGIEDASNELMLADDEEEPARIRIGECFFSMSGDDAQTMLERLQEEKTAAKKAQEDLIAQTDKRMAELKAQLYAKFGTTINLEAD